MHKKFYYAFAIQVIENGKHFLISNSKLFLCVIELMSFEILKLISSIEIHGV